MNSSQANPIAVIGRGNSGTRILSHTLYASGVFMGRRLNEHADTVPGQPMYDACRIVAKHVRWDGGLSWGFDRLHSMAVDPEFEALVQTYLKDVLAWPRPPVGWKLPETTLAYPWIVRMLPEARYLHIVRDPRDSLLTAHLTDDLRKFGVPSPDTDDAMSRRVASWKYQHEIVDATPRPKHFISIRYEDLVLDHEHTMQRLEGFLGIPLARIVIDKTRIGRSRSEPGLPRQLEPLAPHMRELGYGEAEVR
jgi:hypothetical protein